MQADTPLLIVGRHVFTFTDVMIGAAIAGLVLLLAAVILAFRAQSGRRAEAQRTLELEYRLAELSGALQNFASQTQGQGANLQRTLDERLDQVSQRVGYGLSEQSQRTVQSLNALHERLAVIDAAQANLTSLSGEMLSLKDILSNKQTRGAFGQGRMEAIITDGLHSKAYAFQATLSNNTRPDCLISLPDSRLKLVIDAKFPLESYNALRAATNEHETKQAEAQLRSDVLKHVKDIAEKYMISGETHETAIMFVPSESVYAEINERFEDIVQKAHRLRVIFASPNVLMLLVQTMQAIVKDAAMREQAHVIQGEVVKLLEDVGRLGERVSNLRRHFEQAGGDLEKLDISTKAITRRAEKIESLDLADIETPAIAGAKPRLVSQPR
ncbi:MAG: DNA recombination protein RmuC [Aestuariivirga sp.]